VENGGGLFNACAKIVISKKKQVLFISKTGGEAIGRSQRGNGRAADRGV